MSSVNLTIKKLRTSILRSALLDAAIIIIVFIFLYFNADKGIVSTKSQDSVVQVPTVSIIPTMPRSIASITPSSVPTPNPKAVNNCNNLMVLVNKQYALSASYVPPDLVSLSSNGIPEVSGGLMIRAIVIPDLKRMFADAQNAGYALTVVSPYRSYYTQQSLHYNYVLQDGEAYADSYSAIAGHSQHQLGTAIDFGTTSSSDLSQSFGNTPAGIWLAQNAYIYGFIMAYPPNSQSITGYEYEPWHFRYIDVENAFTIKNSGLLLEQYLEKNPILPNC